MAKTGRPKKTDSEILVRITEDYYANEGHGDPATLQCTKLAAYARKCGLDVKDYDFRRDEKVTARIGELKQTKKISQLGGDAGTSAYKTLDIEGLLRSCGDLATLRRKLYDLDCYWHEVHDEAEADRAETRRLHKDREVLTGKLEKAKEELAQSEEDRQSLLSENKHLSAENAWLRKQIRAYLYPALANELLKEENLPHEDSQDIRPEAIADMIEGNRPLPFEGDWGSTEDKKMTRMEELESQMKAQVNDGRKQTGQRKK